MKRLSKLIIVFILGGLLGYWLKPIPKLEIPTTQELKKDSVIRDSIFIVNDCIRTKVIYLEQKYDKETTAIMSSSDSINFEFFTRYLEDYKRTITSN